jgi:PAS domain S-box-containing protein
MGIAVGHKWLGSCRGEVFLAISFVLLFWMLDAGIGAFVFHEGPFLESILNPTASDIVDRFLVLFLAGCFLRYIGRASREAVALEQAVQDALLEAGQERMKLEGIVESIGDAISIQDPEFTVIYQNKAHRKLMGGHVGESCYKAYCEENEVCCGCHLVEAFRDGEVRRVEVPRRRPDGTHIFEIIAAPVRDKNDRITAGVEVVRDVTDRKFVEQTAKKQANLLQHLIDTIPTPIYYQDTSGRFVWCNDAFAEWLAKPRELVIGRRVAQVASQQVALVLDQMQPSPEQGSVQECSFQRPDGSREVVIYRSMFSDGAGERGGVVGVIFDISQRKRAEEEICALNAALTQQALELQQLNRELESFGHAISHDLRTPLTRIYSYAQLLHNYRDRLDEDGVAYVKSVNDGCLQAEALLNALMGLSRVTEVELFVSQVDLTNFAREKANELRISDPARHVEFRIDQDLRVQGDMQLLQIALENLIRNAWKYTSNVPEAVIEIGSFASTDGETVFFVRDNGAGFDSSRSEDLFKPFRRLHTNQQFPGHGLGLATVRRIISRHNGRVWGEGEPGSGATFYFTVSS